MEHMDYIRRMMAYSDQVHTFNFAKKKSMEEGRQEGLEEGLEKGKLEGKREDAKAMLADGLDPARVARITKLPKKQIMALR
jgi:predicted transposase/invertase (TIGR01784 family)